MSAAGSTAYHISKRPLTKWGEFAAFNEKSRAKVSYFGKPMGLWYAYDTTWANSQATHGENAGAYKYLLPLRELVDDPSSPDPDAILVLDETNFDEFLSIYHKKEYIISAKEKLQDYIMQYFMSGDDTIINVLPEELQERLGEEEYLDDPDRVMEERLLAAPEIGENDEGEIFIDGAKLTDEEIEEYIERINEGIKYDPFNKRLVDYTWSNFWKAVSTDFAGVEFRGELVKARNAPRNFRDVDGNTVKVSWLRFLDIVSGCIFHPETYFAGHQPTEFLVTEGGRRQRYHRSKTLRKQRRARASSRRKVY